MTAASVTRSAGGSFGGCASAPDGEGPAGLLWSRRWGGMERLPWPAYLGLGAEGVAARAETALRLLGPGRGPVCPRLWQGGRAGGPHRPGRLGREAGVGAPHFPHFGEEDCLRGRNGSGTIFFSGCNLRCVFCQNFDISWQVHGEPVTPARLAAMMLALQGRGCHNINFVTPEHVVPQII